MRSPVDGTVGSGEEAHEGGIDRARSDRALSPLSSITMTWKFSLGAAFRMARHNEYHDALAIAARFSPFTPYSPCKGKTMPQFRRTEFFETPLLSPCLQHRSGVGMPSIIGGGKNEVNWAYECTVEPRSPAPQ